MKKNNCKNIVFLVIFFLLSLFSFGETTEKQKVLNSVNQLIPYYINGAKSDSGDWMKTTDLSINFDEDWNPYYSFGTIQPFGKINEQGDLLFWQGEYNYRENNKSFSNIGLGLRNLSKNKNKIIGFNIFSDNQEEYNLSRIGFGFEFFRNMTEFKFNYYSPISDDKIIATGSNDEGYTTTYIRAVEGLDYEAAIQSKNHPWAKFSASGYFYNKLYNSNENGFRVRTVLQISPQISTTFYYETSNSVDNNFGGSITYKLSHGFIPSLLKNKWFDNKDLTNKMLQKVDRNSIIKTETYTKLTPYQGNIRVTVINSLNSNLPILGVELQAYKNGVATGDSVVTDSNGQGIISGLDIGTYTVKASYFTSEGTSANISVAKDMTTNGNISLAVKSGKITMTVLDSSANKVSGAKVTATLSSNKTSSKSKNISKAVTKSFSLEATTDSNGQAIFDNLPPGTYTFNVENNEGTISENSPDVTIPDNGGEENVNVVLPDKPVDTSTKGTVSIKVTEDGTTTVIANASIILKQGNTTIDTTTTNAEGLAVFSNLDVGTYSAEISKTDYTTNTSSLVIEADKTINKEVALEVSAVPITLGTISGLTAPVTGEVPDTSVDATAQYTTSVTWDGTPTTFAGGTSYTARITISPKSGYTLTGINTSALDVTGATSESYSNGVITAVFPATAVVPITLGTISTLIAPVTGATPDASVTGTSEYDVTSVTWDNNPTTFAGGTSYTARITISPKSGYTLTGINTSALDVTGATSESYSNGVITAVFPATALVPVTLGTISTLTPPVTGATPDTSVTGTSEYDVTSVTWDNNPTTFASGTSYTARITISAKSGYTLTGINSVSLDVSGATSESYSNGVITAVFPATDLIPVTLGTISTLTTPVTGATPDTTVSGTSEYDVTSVTWDNNPTTFASGTSYTARITISAKSGYTLTGINTASLDVTGATSESYSNGVITAIFPATDLIPVTLGTISSLTAPVTGATPDTTVSGTSEYDVTSVTWDTTPVTFAGGTSYTARITISAKSGYTLTSINSVSLDVTGATSESYSNGVITAVFPATLTPVTLGTISTLTAPVTGATPDTTVTGTSEYDVTSVTWDTTPVTFASGTSYTARITISAKSGYTLTGINTASLDVTGATSKSYSNGVITAVFPATGYISITQGTISSLTAPIKGEVPDTTITDTDEYTASVSWNPSDNPFVASTVYTATITITPKAGYTYSGLASNFFTVGGLIETFNYSTGVITVTFPATFDFPLTMHDYWYTDPSSTIYNYVGFVNGRPSYIASDYPDNTLVYYNNSLTRWEFKDDKNPPYLYCYSSSYTPPKSGWIDDIGWGVTLTDEFFIY